MANSAKIPSRNMKSRINLQTIGATIYEDSTPTQIDCSPFKERENRAYSEMEKALIEIMGTDKAVKLIEQIMIYADTKFQIKFSQGMKAGATLQLKLINNFENDV